jgi:hypothetical protein
VLPVLVSLETSLRRSNPEGRPIPPSRPPVTHAAVADENGHRASSCILCRGCRWLALHRHSPGAPPPHGHGFMAAISTKSAGSTTCTPERDTVICRSACGCRSPSSTLGGELCDFVEEQRARMRRRAGISMEQRSPWSGAVNDLDVFDGSSAAPAAI